MEHNERGKELESEAEFIQLSDACNFLEHYHQEHTTDMVTRFRGKTDRPDIYIVGDPSWKTKFREFVKEIFPERVHTGRLKLRRRHRL